MRSSRHKFYLLTVLLVVAVGVLVVPVITQVIESMMSFDPLGYEPKDASRSQWITSRGITEIFSGAEAYLTIAFLLLCALFFMQSRRD
jgi:Na+-driven multidrug efflux pump